MGNPFEGLEYTLLALLILAPLGLWKVVEIVHWFFYHVSWN